MKARKGSGLRVRDSASSQSHTRQVQGIRSMIRFRAFVAFMGLVCKIALPTEPHADVGPSILLSWGTQGSGPGQFQEPRGIAIDGLGRVYVADFGNNRIQRFGPAGEFQLQWGDEGSENGNFHGPVGVAVSRDGSVYVSENGADATQYQHRVQRFTSDGVFIAKWGAPGHGPGEFNGPLAMAFRTNGNLLVVDAGNDRVQEFTPEGALMSIFGTHGPAPGQFVDPLSIATLEDGRIAVAERGNSAPRVQVLNAFGGPLLSWGSYGGGQGQFVVPFGLAVDHLGRILVADHNEVQVFTEDGQFITEWGSHGTGPGEFSFPRGIAIAPDGDVYVSHSWNHRIQRFGALPTVAHVSSWGRLKTLYRGKDPR